MADDFFWGRCGHDLAGLRQPYTQYLIYERDIFRISSLGSSHRYWRMYIGWAFLLFHFNDTNLVYEAMNLSV